MRLIHKPVLCNYYVTYRCNASCSFCDIWEKPSPYITIENATENLRDLKKLGVKVIDFTGGEPLLHQKIDELLRLAKSFGFLTTLTTNGLLYPKSAEKLKGLVDMLHFSLDYADKADHDLARGVACFDFVKESIDVAKKLGERPDILFTAFPKNIGHLERVYREVCQPNDLVLIINPSFQYNSVEAENLSASDLDYLSKWGRRKGVYLNDAFIHLRREGGNKIEKPVCKAASSTIVISPENKLILPCYHLGLQQFEIKGNLHQLYESNEVKQLVQLEGKLPACEGCTINCYMQPSFAVELNRFWWKALPSTLKYNMMKGTWKALLFSN
ncbi:MAG TPA: radical SAM protein [Cytophagaceae bacterium]|jgi:MoaA/NifB/PqqE/SkfB family radical SAM enzyme